MLKQRLITAAVAAVLTVTAISVNPGTYVNAAEEVTTDNELQFNSISLAQTYKDLTQNNPCITQRFNADPCAMEYNGTVYVYCTNDGDALASAENDNTYGDIKTINCMSSKDMVNWTDHGSINVAGSNGAAKWAGNSWAPTACHKKINGKEKFFLYFANNANGIGVLTSDSPTGPWVDPIGKPLISRSTPNCSNVTWLFDPSVLVDNDGTGYLYFGGGVPTGKEANPQTARVVKLSADMTSIEGTPVTIDAPYLFEDSGINKIGDTYYYSYCTNWSSRTNSSAPGIAKIAYMTSKNPMGPFTYQGTCLDNPGTFFGTAGNNHHSIITLNNKSYIFYHAEWLNKKMYGSQKGYRTTHVNEIGINNGTIYNATGDLKGVDQIANVDPYQLNQMESIAWQGGIKVIGQGDTKVEMNAGDWVGVSNVEFTGTNSISIKAASQSGSTIKLCTDSPTGEAVGYVKIPATGSSNNFKDISVNISNISGNKDLFFVSSGDCTVDNWQFSKSSTGSEEIPNNPDTNTPSDSTVPGTIVTLNDGWYYIKNINAQKYLQVTDNVGKAGQNVDLRTGTGVQGQKWYLKNVGNGYVTLQTSLGDYMLDVANAKNEDGANIGIYNGYSGTAQQFMLKTSSLNGAYVIATKASNLTKVLDDYNFGKTDGTNVCQWTYGGQANQQWVFEPVKTSSTENKPNTPSDPTPNTPSTSTGLKADYTINNWGSAYQVNFKITNNSNAKVNTWTLKLKKSEINISTSWNINIKEDGDYYIITPMSWNSAIDANNSIEFGIQGSGSIGNTINCSIN